MSNISIDYDNTYTADPCVWSFFIGTAKGAGHSVYCTTNRALPDSELDEIMAILEVPVVYAGDRYKEDAILEDLNVKIDIWIDDMPGTICASAILP